nr:hypothetical protein [Tanacetum cinerariifolium]
MDFEEMPIGVFKNILARIDDVPELVGLIALNRRFRDVLLSPTFVAALNKRDHPAPSWLMAQVFDEHNIHFGILLCIKQTGAEERRTFQIPLVEIVSGMSFDISHVAAPHHDFFPRRLEFSSLNGWNIAAATPLQIGDNLIEFNINY